MSQTMPAGPSPATAPPAVDPASRVFSRSILISATRCLLTYIVFPWILPLAGVASGVGPIIGLPIGVIAIVFNLATIRRFWRADHRWKWPVSVICVGVIGLLAVLVALDIAALAG
jgi:hypothetical protein